MVARCASIALALCCLTGCPLVGGGPTITYNELEAIENMQAIMRAQHLFQRTGYLDVNADGTGEFGSLQQLHRVSGGGDEPLIDAVLASGEKTGYQFILTTEPSVDGAPPRYELFAFPTLPLLVGVRFFYADETCIIRAQVMGPSGPYAQPILGRDPDDDGIITSTEEDVYGTNPEMADTDDDGTPDGEEIAAVTRDPLTPDA